MGAKNQVIKVQTFGFKYGIPRVNYYADVTFLKNPAREETSSLDAEFDESILNFIQMQPGVDLFIQNLANLIEQLDSFKFDVVYGIGCNSGKHRSRAVAKLLGDELNIRDVKFDIKHSDLEFG